jgi:hypothetical protein
MAMAPGARRLLSQLAVLLPTLATSAFLGSRGVPVAPRIGVSIGVGLIAIAIVSRFARRSE